MKTRALILVALVGVFFRAQVCAQLNESDTARIQVRAGLTGVSQKGNVDLLVLRGNVEVVANHNRFVIKTQGTSLYQAFSGFKADNDLHSRNYFYVNPFRAVYPFAMVYVQTNYRRQIAFRWFAGAGVTWQIVQTPNTIFKLSTSVVYENTNFKKEQFNEPYYNGVASIDLWRATFYLTGWHEPFDHHVKIFYRAYAQPGLDPVANNRGQIDVGIDFPVWKGMSALVQYSYAYEQVVAFSLQQYDRILTFGVNFQFKK